MTGHRHAPKRMLLMAANKLTGFGKHRYHPYHNPGHKRQGRPRHFTTSIMTDTIMTGQGEAKRHKSHEAHLIPGVDGRKIFGFPNSIITKLRYCTYLDLTGTGGVVQANIFAANGIFDPDISGGGHQPLYRDTYAGIYNHYTVIGSKITVTYAPAVATLPHYIGITGDDDSSTSTNLETLMEQNNAVSTMVGGAGSHPVTLTSTFEPLDAFGVDTKDDGSSATAVGSNPSELWCYKVWAIPADVATLSHCYCRIEIEYTVKFAELTTPTQN